MNLAYIISTIETYKYLALFPLACFEGPLVSLIVGFLIFAGYLNFLPSYIILLFGDIIPDTAYYYLGRLGNHSKLRDKYIQKLKIISGGLDIVEKLWKDHPRKTMFFSKLAYGFSIPFLISAGLVKMSLSKFLSYTIPITLFQYGVLMASGYMLGKSYEAAIKYVQYGGILIAIIFLVFISGYIYVLRYSRNKILAMERTENSQS